MTFREILRRFLRKWNRRRVPDFRLRQLERERNNAA
jgi:hypothetical protein